MTGCRGGALRVIFTRVVAPRGIAAAVVYGTGDDDEDLIALESSRSNSEARAQISARLCGQRYDGSAVTDHR